MRQGGHSSFPAKVGSQVFEDKELQRKFFLLNHLQNARPCIPIIPKGNSSEATRGRG